MTPAADGEPQREHKAASFRDRTFRRGSFHRGALRRGTFRRKDTSS